MKIKPKRNKKYIPKDMSNRLLHIAETQVMLEPLEKIKQSLLRGYLTVYRYVDRMHESREYNDYTMLIYLHQHTFFIQGLLERQDWSIIKYSHRIRQIIEKYFDKLFSMRQGDLVPNEMPISKIGAMKLVWYIENTRLLFKKIKANEYRDAVEYARLMHPIYCGVHDLWLSALIDE